MEFFIKDIPNILLDNDRAYFVLLQSVIDSRDEFAAIEVVKGNGDYKFKITPSDIEYLNDLIKDLTQLHTYLHMRLDFGKSLKKTGTISFSLSSSI